MTPVSAYIDFNVEKVIVNDLIGDPEYVAAKARATRSKTSGSYWDSPEAARMLNACGNEVFQQSMFIDIGGDWCEPFNSILHSTGVFKLRDAGLNEEDRAKAFNSKTLLLTYGPEAPANMNSVLRRTGFFARSFHVDNKLVIASPDSPDPMKEVYVQITGIMADTPARQKFSMENGHGAYKACGGCEFTGTMCANNHVYFLGYHKPVVQFT